MIIGGILGFNLNRLKEMKKKRKRRSIFFKFILVYIGRFISNVIKDYVMEIFFICGKI